MAGSDSRIGIIASGLKRLIQVVFRRTKPANRVSRHLTPSECADFERQMDEHGVEDHTPPLRKKHR